MPNRRLRVHHTVILGLEPAQRMSVESMRVAFFLFVSFVFFLIIIGLLALGSVMSPVRWNERSKPASWACAHGPVSAILFVEPLVCLPRAIGVSHTHTRSWLWWEASAAFHYDGLWI